MSYWIDPDNEPIPKDDKILILVRHKNGQVSTGLYDEAQGEYFVGFDSYGEPKFVAPTHWHPLPEFHPFSSEYYEVAP